MKYLLCNFDKLIFIPNERKNFTLLHLFVEELCTKRKQKTCGVLPFSSESSFSKFLNKQKQNFKLTNLHKCCLLISKVFFTYLISKNMLKIYCKRKIFNPLH